MPSMTYTGPAALTIPTHDGVTAITLDVELRVERCPDDAFLQWSGTGRTRDSFTWPDDKCTLALPGHGTALVHLLETDGTTIEIQGQGPAPWWPDTGR
ncbi:hypothetical protein [Streptomyces sp. NPDC049881]|uniref:hypothetical protein n=1 Tax=Streptomyces sp. NPDC049881 TaxID=3155778 RepID=UPI00342862F8